MSPSVALTAANKSLIFDPIPMAWPWLLARRNASHARHTITRARTHAHAHAPHRTTVRSAQIIEGRVLCVHGGLSPDIRTLDQIRREQRRVPPSTLSGGRAFEA